MTGLSKTLENFSHLWLCALRVAEFLVFCYQMINLLVTSSPYHSFTISHYSAILVSYQPIHNLMHFLCLCWHSHHLWTIYVYL